MAAGWLSLSFKTTRFFFVGVIHTHTHTHHTYIYTTHTPHVRRGKTLARLYEGIGFIPTSNTLGLQRHNAVILATRFKFSFSFAFRGSSSF